MTSRSEFFNTCNPNVIRRKPREIIKPKCIYYTKKGFCKNGDRCQFYHPPLCKFRDNCKFKNTTCRFFHIPQLPKPDFILNKIAFPTLNENGEDDNVNHDSNTMSFKDVCQHFENGKLVFQIDKNSDLNSIFTKIRTCLDNNSATEFVFKKVD